MKKVFVLLMIMFTMALAFCGCGGRDGASDSRGDSRPTNQESISSQPTDQEPISSLPANPDSAAGEIHSLTDWYNSDDRIQLETAYAGQMEAMGMTCFVDVEEPDTLILNYKYTEQLDFGDASQEEIDAVYAQSLQSMSGLFASSFSDFEEEYGIPLNIIRFAYLNADGSLITAIDFSADSQSPDVSAGSSESAFSSLADWLNSEEADATVAEVNNQLAYSGMTFRLSAEDNTLIYEYYVSDTLGLKELSSEELTLQLSGAVDSQREGLLALFDLFRNEYDITLDAVRLVFFTEDGSEILYSSQIP